MNTSEYVPSEESLNEEGNLGELNNSTCHIGNIVAAAIPSAFSTNARVAPIMEGSDNDATSMSMDEAPLQGVIVEAFAIPANALTNIPVAVAIRSRQIEPLSLEDEPSYHQHRRPKYTPYCSIIACSLCAAFLLVMIIAIIGGSESNNDNTHGDGDGDASPRSSSTSYSYWSPSSVSESQITVTSPKEGSIYTVGDWVPVAWESSGLTTYADDTVRILVSYCTRNEGFKKCSANYDCSKTFMWYDRFKSGKFSFLYPYDSVYFCLEDSIDDAVFGYSGKFTVKSGEISDDSSSRRRRTVRLRGQSSQAGQELAHLEAEAE
jgi:hypothetical protein